ncbi:MAG: hypothetical protein ABFD12_13320, partial [Syntrophorhabdus sp.]
MAAKNTKQAKNKDTDRTRSRRFLFLWLPVIIIVIAIFWIIAMDPPQPTGRSLKARVIEKDTSIQT